jgi:hypothetical protein
MDFSLVKEHLPIATFTTFVKLHNVPSHRTSVAAGAMQAQGKLKSLGAARFRGHFIGEALPGF